MHVIAFDIETAPQPLDRLTDRQRRRHDLLWQEELARRPETHPDEASRKVRSLHPMLGWITCISVLRDGSEPHSLEDLGQAQRILQQVAFVPRHPAWLAQQAAEKALKAVLIAAGTPFPRTHDLDALLRLTPEKSSVRGAEADLARLTEFAVDSRYPGDWPDLSEADARAAVADAARVVAAAETDLRADA